LKYTAHPSGTNLIKTEIAILTKREIKEKSDGLRYCLLQFHLFVII